MPVKLPPTTLLRSSLPVSRSHQMILNSTRHPSRAPPVFCRVFPFKLKYLGLGFSPPNSHLPRSFSTRPFRAKPDRNPHEGEIRASKSLIEDEDELSDWVSGLRTSSYKSGVFTEDEEESEYGKGKKRGRDGVRVRGLGELGEDGGGSRRRREREFSGGGGDEMGQMERPGSRKLSNLGKKSSGFGRRFEEEDDGGQGFSRKEGPIRGGIRRGDRAFGVRNSRRFGNESEEEEDEDDSGWTLGRKKGGVRQGSKRGEKGFEAKDRWVRGDRRVGSVKNGGVGRVAFGSQNENSDFARRGEKSVSSFMDLMGDEDSEEGISGDEDDDEDEDEIKCRSALFPKKVARQSSPPSSPSRSGSYLSETRFDQCAISPLTLKAIKDVGYENMTVVQEATLPVILKGKDVMAKAKTGTGKTVAFLLPSIEVAVKSPPASRDQKRPPILVLVICPTRELASQAAAEASSLLKYHPTLGVQVVMGGTRLAVEQKRMQANPCQILVATPGRLRDHLENTAGFATRLMGVKVLVLDEADHLLDMGFRKDIERIIAAVPKQRQTLMFSATIPEEVRQVCHIALKRDHEFIDTVEEGSEETHSQVRQMHLVAPLDKHFSLLYAILKEHISDDVNYKVLVFCTTAMVTRLVADLLGELNLNVREIHSRKAQSYRTKVSDEFRKSKGLILVTSDVSARGVDYPDVTLVIQLGLPSDREQYIHRLGRTGRKGKEGVGILMLAPWEEFFLLSIKDLPISKSPMPMVDPDLRKKVERALAHVEMKNKETAYQAWLGYYNSNKIIARDKLRLVELANEFSRSMGLDNPPAIPKLVLGKMGLKNVPGLRSK